MTHAAGWNKYGGPRRKLNSELQSKQDQVATKGVVVVTQCGEGAEPMGEVVVVGVFQRDGCGSTVEAGGGKDAIREVVREVGVLFKERL